MIQRKENRISIGPCVPIEKKVRCDAVSSPLVSSLSLARVTPSPLTLLIPCRDSLQTPSSAPSLSVLLLWQYPDPSKMTRAGDHGNLLSVPALSLGFTIHQLSSHLASLPSNLIIDVVVAVVAVVVGCRRWCNVDRHNTYAVVLHFVGSIWCQRDRLGRRAGPPRLKPRSLLFPA